MIDLPLARSGQGAFEVANQAVREAGHVIMAHFHSEKRVSYKAGRSHIVTDVDVLAEEKIMALLQQEYPDFGIVTEESPNIVGDSSCTWIIDPIDGTRNYAYGIPHFCVALALVQKEEVLLGVIYDPVRDELFRGEKGKGAFLNDSPIAVSRMASLEAAVIGFDMGYDAEVGREMLAVASALWPGVQTVRVMGSAALGLAYAACGRLDLYFHLFLYPWDLAAGILIVGEAGGVITELDGTPVTIHSKRIIAANREVHEDFIRRVNERG